MLFLVACTPSPSATKSSPSPRHGELQIIRTISIGRSTQVTGLAISTGEVWVASPAAAPYPAATAAVGTILRFDAMNGTQLSTLTTAGNPVGLVVSGSFLWVAGGSGDQSVTLAAADSVVQSDAATGR